MRFRHFVSSSRTVVLPAIALLLFAWLGCASAQRVESPLELIYAPDNMLVAGRLIEINPTGRIVVERGEVMSGKIKPPAKIDVRVAMDVLPTLKTGERYIVAYSMFRRDPRKAVG